MKATGKRLATPDDQGDSIGLLGNGTSGEWEISIDESSSGDRRWMHLEGRAASFYFEIKSLDVIEKWWQFLTDPAGSDS
ncbi:MAG: hypothetical protein SFU86_22040, partial [Pirellulaceae bacterium]|nr:hypothetical protein [Pirellulaceae bacterium]